MGREQTEGAGMFAAHDLVIRSTIPLPGLRAAPGGETDRCDLTVDAPAGQPARVDTADGDTTDEVMVAEDSTEGRRLTVTRTAGGGLRLRGEGLEMTIDAGGEALEASCEPERAGALGWWVGGLGLAAVLLQRGHLVLHGSMVSRDHRGALLMAPSGHGKSISAAAACAAGWSLVAEDTVRVDRTGERFSAPPGSHVLRTRRTSAEMESMFPAHEVENSSDGRVAVEPPASTERTPVDRLIFLKLDPEATEAHVDEVDPMTALTAGLGHLRVPGLVDAELAASCFDQVAALVDATPARLFHLPWNGELGEFGDHIARCLETC